MSPEGKKIVSDGLQYTGLGFKIVGTGLVCTGVGGLVGAAMIGVGEGMSIAGSAIEVQNELQQGNTAKAANAAIWTAVGVGGGKAIGSMRGMDAAGEAVLSTSLDVITTGTEAGVEQVIEQNRTPKQ